MGKAISIVMIIWLSLFALGTWSQASDGFEYRYWKENPVLVKKALQSIAFDTLRSMAEYKALNHEQTAQFVTCYADGAYNSMLDLGPRLFKQNIDDDAFMVQYLGESAGDCLLELIIEHPGLAEKMYN